MKNTFIFAFLLAALTMIGCTKENITPQSNPVVAVTPQSNPIYVEQMTSAFMNCQDTATHINSNLSGTVSTASNYTLYDFTTVTDDGAKMHFKVKDRNSGIVANGDTLVMNYVVYTPSCGTDSVNLQLGHVMPTFTVNTNADGSIVTLHYHDCALPLNGMSGTISVTWRQ